MSYRDGKGVTQDYKEAAKWFRKAAEKGDAFGQRELGLCYETGKGVGKDQKEAEKWLTIAKPGLPRTRRLVPAEH